ncbi:hypothetical protein [Dyella mobilis]|uniref:Uncharacterized protein n=1 Tax=Dyella mobilis TaxID=1849582 RepID=A0ABS2KDW6_9GAMM|nr:hypothetical protein [Dyella mobilis]MBM7129360.1 hypothetical protein [Dyella mobilis]GLQ98654.1 hypothetical protein GCM10007863_30740 [Dyella mobilis]
MEAQALTHPYDMSARVCGVRVLSKTGSLAEIILASRGGSAATGGTTNLVSQLVQNGGHFGQVNYIDVGAAVTGGYLGYGGGAVWNGLVGTGVGMAQTEANNLYYGKNDSILLGGIANGAATAIGFKLGDAIGSRPVTGPFTSLKPIVWVGVIGNGASEFINWSISNMSNDDQESGVSDK